MKTLEDIGSPPGFDGEPDYNAETDEEERKLYESLMLATASGFDEAVAALPLSSSAISAPSWRRRPRMSPAYAAGWGDARLRDSRWMRS